MSFGESCRKNCEIAPPSLVSGKLIGSPANATAPKRAPGKSATSWLTSVLARAMRDGFTSRACMLFE
jgi:hypothetical protein